MPESTIQIVTTPEGLQSVVNAVTAASVFVFDVETMPASDSLPNTRGDTWRNTVMWIAVSDGEQSWVIPMGHPNGDFIEMIPLLKETPDLTARIARGLSPRKSDYSVDMSKAHLVFSEPPEQLTRTEVFRALKPLFMSTEILKVGHNLAFDLGAVTKYIGGIPEAPYFDTMIAAFLVDSSKGYGFGLKDVSKKYAGVEMQKGVGAEIEKHSFIEVAKYAELDVVATTKVWKVLRDRLEKDGLIKVFNLEMDVLRVVTEMRLTGVSIDTESLSGLKDRLDRDIETVKARVYRMAGETFNLNSSAVKQRILFASKKDGGRGLKPTLLTPKGKDKKKAREPLSITDYSVSAEALEPFRDADPLVTALLEYADLNKLQSTYVLPYMGGIVTRQIGTKVKYEKKEPLLDRGRLHTDFNQIGAATGRLSSRNPNLQNVPHPGTEYGKLIRNLFMAGKDERLIVADYSQIEPRTIASFSRDPVMLQTYKDGGDIYTAIGETMGVDRKAGKVLVLSIAYGVGPDKIAAQIGCTVEEAQDLLGAFSEKFKNIGRLKALTVRTARAKSPVPYVGTITGRRRYLPDLKSTIWWQVAKAERQAFNTLIQGSAADIMKIAMVRAHRQIHESASLILTVHDELVTVAPAHLAEQTAEDIREAMESISILRVPLLADVRIVDKWGEAK
jgi:DNA polymerase I-like protein with 3'-5' exonuclease and polymerase domains